MLNGLNTIWLMGAAACLTLALIHLGVWILHRQNRVHLLFAVAAGAVAGVAVCEVQLMRAQAPEEFGAALRWMHVPFFFAVVSIVWFVRIFFGAGRVWLAWTVTGLRFLCLVLNFVYSPNFNYSQINAVRQVEVFGGSGVGGGTVAVAVGVLSGRTVLGHATCLLMLAFVIDASIAAWRRGSGASRRRVLIVGASVAIFFLASLGQTGLVLAGVIKTPYMISLAFLIPIAATGYQLAVDIARSTQLSSELDRSKAELHDSAESMDLAAHAAGLAMWTWDGDKDEVWLSERGRALFGLSDIRRLSLERFLRVLHPDDRQTVLSSVVNTTRQDNEYQGEFRVLMPDGGLRWVASRGRVVFNGRSTPIRMHGVSIDVTARKEAEEVLRESEARFREMADAAPAMIWTAGLDRRCTFVNKGWLDFTGRRLEQELGDGWTENLHPDDLERCWDVYVKAFDARTKFTMEYRLRGVNGEYRWVLDTGVPRLSPGGALLGYIGTAIEITERKRAEERIRQIVEVSPSAIVMMDVDGVIKLVNAQARSVFGYPGNELVGHTIEMLVPDWEVAAQSNGRLQHTSVEQARDGVAGHELIGRRKDGSEVPIEFSLSPMETSEGTFILASIIDITQRQAAERDQMQQRNELFHLSRVAVLGELLGSLSHELHQPLTAILANAQAAQQLLAATPMDEDEVEAILEDIVSADKRASEVISRLRLLFRKGDVQYEALDLNAVALDVLELMEGDLVYHEVALHTELAGDLPKIKGDRVQLQQVFINLIVNATDAMDDLPPADRKLFVRTRLDDHGCVELRITDTGCGIPAGQMERVFQPFHTTKAKGTGLGLAVCRTIISAHSGTLWATNNPDRGASFHVALSPEPAGTL